MHTCQDCHRSFPTALALELHRDVCEASDLLCRRCGGRFRERDATRDGWHYRCPNDDCTGSGRGEDIVDVEHARVRQ